MREWMDEEDETESAPPLTRSEAQALLHRQKMPSVSFLLFGQVLVVTLVAVLVGFFWGVVPSQSLLYGGFCWLLPSIGMAWGLGLIGGRSRREKPALAELLVVRFFVWEAVKLVVALILLFLAPQVLPQVQWLALLLGLILAAKAQWLIFGVKRVF